MSTLCWISHLASKKKQQPKFEITWGCSWFVIFESTISLSSYKHALTRLLVFRKQKEQLFRSETQRRFSHTCWRTTPHKTFPKKINVSGDDKRGPPSRALTSSQSSCDAQCVSWYERVPEREGMGKNALPPFTVVNWAKTNPGRGTAGPERFTWPRAVLLALASFTAIVFHTTLYIIHQCALSHLELFLPSMNVVVRNIWSRDEALNSGCSMFQRGLFRKAFFSLRFFKKYIYIYIYIYLFIFLAQFTVCYSPNY